MCSARRVRAEVPNRDLIAAGRRQELHAPPPLDIGEARRWIDEVATVALADGQGPGGTGA